MKYLTTTSPYVATQQMKHVRTLFQNFLIFSFWVDKFIYPYPPRKDVAQIRHVENCKIIWSVATCILCVCLKYKASNHYEFACYTTDKIRTNHFSKFSYFLFLHSSFWKDAIPILGSTALRWLTEEGFHRSEIRCNRQRMKRGASASIKNTHSAHNTQKNIRNVQWKIIIIITYGKNNFLFRLHSQSSCQIRRFTFGGGKNI